MHEITNLSLIDVLENSKKHFYRIPDFQRDFKWKPTQTSKLIESMFYKYPIGNFLMLSCQSNLKLKYKDLDANKAIFNDKAEDNYCFYVLDGQQRITSLVRVFEGGDDRYKYYLNLEEFYKFINSESSNLANENELIYAHNLKDKKNSEINLKYLDLSTIFTDLSINTKIRKFMNNNTDLVFKEEDTIENKREKEDKFLIQCTKAFTELGTYSIPIQKLDKNSNVESIVRIFETINNTGIKLGVFDLSVAKTFQNKEVDGEDFNLRDKFNDLKNKNELKDLSGESVLNAILYSQQISNDKYNDYIISTKEKLLDLDCTYIKENIEKLINSFKNVEDFLLENKITPSKVPKNIKIMLAVADRSFNILSKNIDERIKKLILFRWLDEDLYNREKINKDLIIFKKYSKNEEIEKLDLDLKIEIKFSELKKEQILDTNNKLKNYEAYLFIINDKVEKDLHNKDINYSCVEFHHLLPESYIKTTYKTDNTVYKLKDSIANLTIITSEVNKYISNNCPTKYFNELKEKFKPSELNVIFKNNLIPFDENQEINQFFNQDNGDYIFLEKRAETIAKIINLYFKI